MLSRKDLLTETAPNIGKHPVAELGGDVGLAEFTADEADRISRLTDDDVPASVRIVIMGACDADGTRLFTEKDIPVLRKRLGKVMGPLANAILAHNSLTAKTQEDAKNA